jgi:hypothetical protein
VKTGSDVPLHITSGGVPLEQRLTMAVGQ